MKMSDLAFLKKYAQNYSILCVEDSKALLTQEVNFLKKIFKEVYTASDGVKGLEVYKSKKPNLVLTDLNMPNMNGFEMIRELKKIDYNVQIIIISAYSDFDNLLESIHIGVTDFVPKPINMELFQSALMKGIDHLLRLEESLMTDDLDMDYENDVINALVSIKKIGNEIQLVNHYRGVPIIHNATIKKLDNDYIVLSTLQIQRLAIEFEHMTTIASDLFPGEIEADLKSTNPATSDIMLKNVRFVEASVRKRENVRVEVDKGFYIVLHKDKQSFNGAVEDISVKSVNLKVDSSLKVDKDDELLVVLKFHYTQKTMYHEFKHSDAIKCKAKVLKKNIVDNDLYLVLIFEMSKHDEQILSKFIYHREIELIEEFKLLQANK
jgi:YesN/AraC family two-component response regulator